MGLPHACSWEACDDPAANHAAGLPPLTMLPFLFDDIVLWGPHNALGGLGRICTGVAAAAP